MFIWEYNLAQVTDKPYHIMFLRDTSWGNQNNLTLVKNNLGGLTVRVLNCSESPVVDLIFQIILLRMLRGEGVANYINVALSV
jgi:hypothetical protein